MSKSWGLRNKACLWLLFFQTDRKAEPEIKSRLMVELSVFEMCVWSLEKFADEQRGGSLYDQCLDRYTNAEVSFL